MRYILLALLALAPSLSHAEDHFGVIAGMNYSDLRGVGDGSDWKNYFFPGLYADFGLSDNAFISPQLRYMRKGFSFDDTVTSGLFDVDFAIKYIELPIYYKYKFSGSGSFRPNLFAGPAFGIKVGDSITVTNRSTGQATTLRNIGKSGIRSYDLAAEAGAGMEFMLSPDVVASVNLTYSYGVINLDKSGGDNIKSQGIQVYGGIGF